MKIYLTEVSHNQLYWCNTQLTANEEKTIFKNFENKISNSLLDNVPIAKTDFSLLTFPKTREIRFRAFNLV